MRAWAPLAVASSAAGDEVEQADDVGPREALRLSGQPSVALGSDAQLGGHLAEHLDGEQLAAVDLEVAEDLARIAAGGGKRAGAAQRLGGITRDDCVERLEQLLGIGDAEHGEHVGGSIVSVPA